MGNSRDRIPAVMQRGSVIVQRNRWCLRYYDTVIVDGRTVRKKCFKVLAKVSSDYPNKTSVEPLAAKFLQPINDKSVVPESSLPVTEFFERYYLPHAKQTLRPSTVKSYNDHYKYHLKPRLGDLRLRDARTVHFQRMLSDIKGLSHQSLLRVRATLSAVFSYAIRQGVLEGTNPLHAVRVPGRSKKFHGHTYTIEEIVRTTEALKDVTAFTVISVAAFSGLRLGEIRGLHWKDFDGASLSVERTVWRTHIGPPKTDDSEAKVPCLPILAKILNEYKQHTRWSQSHDYIFAGQRRGQSLNLHNLATRVIKPAMKEAGIAWKGFHSFRRGLATNLFDLQVEARTVMAILRHASVQTTLNHYVQPSDTKTRQALEKIEDAFEHVLDRPTYYVEPLDTEGA